MTNHITTCVNCHADDTSIDGAYCSDECKHENESPSTKPYVPSARQREVQGEIEALIERDAEVRIGR